MSCRILRRILNHKEADVEVWAQSFLKNALGFTVTNGYSIRAQESKGKMRPGFDGL
jgi:hypothetical protein